MSQSRWLWIRSEGKTCITSPNDLCVPVYACNKRSRETVLLLCTLLSLHSCRCCRCCDFIRKHSNILLPGLRISSLMYRRLHAAALLFWHGRFSLYTAGIRKCCSLNCRRQQIWLFNYACCFRLPGSYTRFTSDICATSQIATDDGNTLKIGPLPL